MKGKKVGLTQYSDPTPEIPRLRKVIGQLEGTEKMIREGRYCVDILQQIRAAHSALKALEVAILKGHLHTCLAESAKIESPNAFKQRLSELLKLIRA